MSAASSTILLVVSGLSAIVHPLNVHAFWFEQSFAGIPAWPSSAAMMPRAKHASRPLRHGTLSLPVAAIGGRARALTKGQTRRSCGLLSGSAARCPTPCLLSVALPHVRARISSRNRRTLSRGSSRHNGSFFSPYLFDIGRPHPPADEACPPFSDTPSIFCR